MITPEWGGCGLGTRLRISRDVMLCARAQFGACAPRGESWRRTRARTWRLYKNFTFGSSGHSDRLFTVPGAPSCVFFEFAVQRRTGPISVMKFYILTGAALALTFTLTSANADFKAPAFHILKDLGTKQVLTAVGDCSGNYVTHFFTNGEGLDCALTLAQLPDDVSDEDLNEVWCTGACAEAYITLYEECNSLGGEQTYRATCGRGPGGKLCINIDTEQFNIGSPVLANAVSDCPDSDSCTEACKASIAAGIETYGCCVNNYFG